MSLTAQQQASQRNAKIGPASQFPNQSGANSFGQNQQIVNRIPQTTQYQAPGGQQQRANPHQIAKMQFTAGSQPTSIHQNGASQNFTQNLPRQPQSRFSQNGGGLNFTNIPPRQTPTYIQDINGSVMRPQVPTAASMSRDSPNKLQSPQISFHSQRPQASSQPTQPSHISQSTPVPASDWSGNMPATQAASKKSKGMIHKRGRGVQKVAPQSSPPIQNQQQNTPGYQQNSEEEAPRRELEYTRQIQNAEENSEMVPEPDINTSYFYDTPTQQNGELKGRVLNQSNNNNTFQYRLSSHSSTMPDHYNRQNSHHESQDNASQLWPPLGGFGPSYPKLSESIIQADVENSYDSDDEDLPRQDEAAIPHHTSARSQSSSKQSEPVEETELSTTTSEVTVPWDEDLVNAGLRDEIFSGLHPGVLKIETVAEAERVCQKLLDISRKEPDRIFACDTEVNSLRPSLTPLLMFLTCYASQLILWNALTELLAFSYLILFWSLISFGTIVESFLLYMRRRSNLL